MPERTLHTFWNNKKVLVTGHTGFKGSWLCIFLKLLGADVVGYSLNPANENDNFLVCGLQEKTTDIRGDIINLENLRGVFDKHKPEIIFHMAAQSILPESYSQPKLTYETNVMGTLNVLECIRSRTYPCYGVLITTDKCYENKEQMWGYRETDTLGGYDPYSSSKACAELLISSYRNSFMNTETFDDHHKAIASARAGNVIGGGDWSSFRIIPDCVRALEKGDLIKLRNPMATRPWQHVIELLYGYILLAENLCKNPEHFSGGWNFGPDQPRNANVLELAELIVEKWGNGEINTVYNNSFHETKTLTLDITKAKTLLKWQPSLDIETAIQMTVDWYKNYKSDDIYDFCCDQIKQYIDKYAKELR